MRPWSLFKCQKSFLSDRFATLVPGTAVVPRTTVAHVVCKSQILPPVLLLTPQIDCYIAPFEIGLSPITILTGFFVLCVYGFAVGLAVEVPIFLQSPEVAGGYGFTPLQNAACKCTKLYMR